MNFLKVGALFLLLLSIQVVALPAPPQPVPGGWQAAGVLRAFVVQDAFSYVAEIAANRETAGRGFEEVALGTYYRVYPLWKVGVFVARELGLRHDEDWQAVGGKWSWVDSNDRGETLITLDSTERVAPPGQDWAFEVKTRYIYNSFNDNRTLLLRPGFTWFYMRDGNLLATLFVQVEWDFPLNFGAELVSERWLYVGSLYHWTETVDIGPFLAFGWQTWNGPQGYADKGGAPYDVTTQTNTLGVTTVVRF